MVVFTLTGPDKGKNLVILEKYKFVDGKMFEASPANAEKYHKVLRYYGVEMSAVSEKDVVETESKDNSLAKDVTQKGTAAPAAAPADKK